VCVLQ